MVPTTGVEGVGGCALITALADTGEVQPSAFRTAKLYVPAGSDEMVTLDPVPVEEEPPG